MLVYNEKSGVEVVADFHDATGTPTLPVTVHYNLWCEATNTELLADTVATVVTDTDSAGVVTYTATIEIPSSLNAIQSTGNRQETKALLVIANKGLDSEYSKEYRYLVKNVLGRS